jgi:HD-like signal output (HDOD) protein
MKKLISRFFGMQDVAVPATQPVDMPPEQMRMELEAVYYRWLTSSAGYNAPRDVESEILDRVRTLSENPEGAAGLVPRIPEVIPRLLRSLRGEEVSNAELARQVAQDLVLVAEVIREANSAYYRPGMPVKNIESAIMMLGQNGLRMLLARLSFRPLVKMQTGGFARRAAPQIWSQSEKCALAASLMAPGLTAGAFEAYLAGLMQNVGLIVALRLSDQVCGDGKVPGSSAFGLELLARSRQLSARIATHWDFPPEVSAAITQRDESDDFLLARALAQGDRLAKLRLLIDADVLAEDDVLVTTGLDNFQLRCLGKLGDLEN